MSGRINHQMITRFGLLTVLVTAGAAVRPVAAQAQVFKYGAKVYKASDLATADQQSLFDIETEEYAKRAALLQQAALNVYLTEEAKKAGKTKAELEATLLAVPEPTDKQATEWFEQNKSRIPPGYTFDKVAGEIKGLLREQGLREKREALLTKLKTDGKLVLLIKEPDAPLVQVDTKDLPVRGSAKAKVTVVEFADYQCPHCKMVAPTLDELVKKHPDKVKLVFMDYPIKGASSELIAQGAYCAGEQGKFWEFHDLAFEKQQDLASSEAATNLAKTLKLDESKFASCLQSPAARARVAKSKAEGDRLGVTGTPAIYIGGRRVKSHDLADFEKVVQKAVAK
ncbi:MAG: hypothetical protein FJ146_08950 [Deltaproteobacteria bacterium]|nr:hypothetical protein [Deltaproteobacteria bacterium]